MDVEARSRPMSLSIALYHVYFYMLVGGTHMFKCVRVYMSDTVCHVPMCVEAGG